MISKTLVVKNQIGIHSRPAALLVEIAKKYDCSAAISKADTDANMRSIVSILCLKAKRDDEVTVTFDGKDEEEAMTATVELFESKFGEE